MGRPFLITVDAERKRAAAHDSPPPLLFHLLLHPFCFEEANWFQMHSLTACLHNKITT